MKIITLNLYLEKNEKKNSLIIIILWTHCNFIHIKTNVHQINKLPYNKNIIKIIIRKLYIYVV